MFHVCSRVSACVCERLSSRCLRGLRPNAAGQITRRDATSLKGRSHPRGKCTCASHGRLLLKAIGWCRRILDPPVFKYGLRKVDCVNEVFVKLLASSRAARYLDYALGGGNIDDNINVYISLSVLRYWFIREGNFAVEIIVDFSQREADGDISRYNGLFYLRSPQCCLYLEDWNALLEKSLEVPSDSREFGAIPQRMSSVENS